jgi:hypothetical protein
MKSAAGNKAKANYQKLKVYKGWKNAHHIQNIAVNKLEDGIINLEADIIYQNLKSDGSNDSYPLHYSTFLKKFLVLLPVFTEINIKPTGEIKTNV